MPYKTDKHTQAILKGLDQKQSLLDISRKVYISYPTNVFIDNEELEFEIRDAVASRFNVPLFTVQVAGSAKTGYSFHQQKDFIPGKSDLDLAIIDQALFFSYMEVVYKITKGYTDLTSFPRKDGKSTFPRYRECLSFGLLRPDLMPSSRLKDEWFGFFRSLSAKHIKLFKNINSAIYSTPFFFEWKQMPNIEMYQAESGGKK